MITAQCEVCKRWPMAPLRARASHAKETATWCEGCRSSLRGWERRHRLRADPRKWARARQAGLALLKPVAEKACAFCLRRTRGRDEANDPACRVGFGCNTRVNPAERTWTMDENNAEKSAAPRQMRGFAAMSPEKQREIASRGGKASHAKGTGHQWTPEAARAAGRKGGVVSRGGRGKLPPEGL